MTSSVLTGTSTQTVQAFLDAFARHDVDAAMALVDPRASVTVVTATGGSGNNDVLNVMAAVSSTISEGSGNNQVINASDSIGCAFHGGSGHNDKLNIAPGHNVVNVAASSGNMTISGATSTDIINIAEGAHVHVVGVDPTIHYV